MASEILKLTTEIVVFHVSMTDLTSEQLVNEIKTVYNVLSSLDGGATLEELVEARPGDKTVKKSSIPLKDIVKAKYVVCLECGKKLKTLKAHLRKAHDLMAKEYFQRYGLDPKKYPLVCLEYSAQRSAMAKNRGFGERGTHHKATS